MTIKWQGISNHQLGNALVDLESKILCQRNSIKFYLTVFLSSTNDFVVLVAEDQDADKPEH